MVPETVRSIPATTPSIGGRRFEKTGQASLLIADDEEANRLALAWLLRHQGYRVSMAESGSRALDLLRQNRFDLVLLDIVMHEVSGLHVLKALRQTHSATELPVIMVTGLDQSEAVVEALGLGANDYVTKPLDLPVLLARVRTQLSHKRAVERVVRLERDLARRNRSLEAANSRMRDDLAAAARVQNAFLPGEVPSLPGTACSWLFRPCEQLAGDMLNVFPLGDHSVGFYLLDVSGHGVAAALLAVTLSRMLQPTPDRASLLMRRSDAGSRIVSPAEVASLLNTRFPWDPVAQQFFTIVYGVLDARTDECRYVSAGHPSPIHAPAHGAAQIFSKSGLPIGVMKSTYEEQIVHLSPGDRLVLYSDGVFEAPSSSGELFGIERLCRAIERARMLALPDALQTVHTEVQSWTGNAPLRDDVSMLALQFTGQ